MSTYEFQIDYTGEVEIDAYEIYQDIEPYIDDNIRCTVEDEIPDVEESVRDLLDTYLASHTPCRTGNKFQMAVWKAMEADDAPKACEHGTIVPEWLPTFVAKEVRAVFANMLQQFVSNPDAE